MVCPHGVGQRFLISADDDFIGLRPYLKDKCGMTKRQPEPFALSYGIMDNTFMPSKYLSVRRDKISCREFLPVFSLTVSSIKEA